MKSVLVLCGVAFLLGGCETLGPATIKSACDDVFTDPGFKVIGKRHKDKQWIGNTQETGIKVCGWKRPTGT